jgi:kumamolisin
MKAGKAPLQGGERSVFKTARKVGRPDPGERIEVDVIVRHTPSSGGLPTLEEMAEMRPRDYFTHERFEETYGADPGELAAVEHFAREHELVILGTDRAKRVVKLSGTIAQISRAFHVDLAHYAREGSYCRGHEGPVHVPAELSGIVEGVFGLDNWRILRPHIQASVEGSEKHLEEGIFYPTEVADFYRFPPDLDGKGQCVGILEFGGGFDGPTLKRYFEEHLKRPMPAVSWVPVDAGENRPGVNPEVDAEVMLDIQMAGAVAPGSRIVVYFTPALSHGPGAPSSSKCFIDALNTAINDRENRPSVISISWGGPELQMSTAEMMQYNNLVVQAGMKGITVCVSSGDNGSSFGVAEGAAGWVAVTDYPASSPGVLACGGTKIVVRNGRITEEVVWNNLADIMVIEKDGRKIYRNCGATGGGVSVSNDLPFYQKPADVPGAAMRRHVIVDEQGKQKVVPCTGRGVPDVAANACPESGYKILRNCQSRTSLAAGTSAVAPLWAALVARVNQGLGARVGFLNPKLYELQLKRKAEIFRPITSGTNGAYTAAAGQKWNACTGLGVPDGRTLFEAMRGHLQERRGA